DGGRVGRALLRLRGRLRRLGLGGLELDAGRRRGPRVGGGLGRGLGRGLLGVSAFRCVVRVPCRLDFAGLGFGLLSVVRCGAIRYGVVCLDVALFGVALCGVSVFGLVFFFGVDDVEALQFGVPLGGVGLTVPVGRRGAREPFGRLRYASRL